MAIPIRRVIESKKGVSPEKVLERLINRMFDPFEDGPGFGSLKNLFLRPLLNSEKTYILISERWKLMSRPLECVEIWIFNGLASYMSRQELSSHMSPLVDVFKCLLARHQSNCSETAKECLEASKCVDNFTRFYVNQKHLEASLLVEDEDDISEELVRFVEYVVLTTPIKLKILLQRLFYTFRSVPGAPFTMHYLLTCFNKERFHAAYDIKESDFLMENLSESHKMLNAVLIIHGFKYSFHPAYYRNCLFTLYRCVHGGTPVNNITSAFLGSGNLRMQMALEILLYNIYRLEGHGVFLYMLWQSRPDPFITPDELQLFEPFFVQGSTDLVDAWAMYQGLMPGVPEVKRPRSLKHLARVRIRESMVRAHTFSETAVRSLGLPKMIDDYLWKLGAKFETEVILDYEEEVVMLKNVLSIN